MNIHVNRNNRKKCLILAAAAAVLLGVAVTAALLPGRPEEQGDFAVDERTETSGMPSHSCLPAVKGEKSPSERRRLHLLYFLRRVSLRQLSEKAPCVSLGLQQSKIQFKGHHPI